MFTRARPPFIASLVTIIFSCFQTSLPAVAQSVPARIAVLDLTNSTDLGESERLYLTDTVRMAALSLPRDGYLIMTRENILVLLPPGVDLTTCTGTACEIEFGRLVGADFIVSGELLFVGTNYRVSLRLHDVTSGALLSQQQGAAPNVDGLVEEVGVVSRLLFAELSGGEASAETEPNFEVDQTRSTTGSELRSVSLGFEHTCAATGGGRVYCYGGSDRYAGGNGLGWATSAVMIDGPRDFDSIAAGFRRVCGVRASGEALCGGLSSWEVVATGEEFSQIVLGYYHSCGLLRDRTVMCWGSAPYIRDGQIGNGSFHRHDEPTNVIGLSDVTAITTGWNHTCTLTSSGEVWCWGLNDKGQLGDGTTDNRSTPVLVQGLGAVRAVSAFGHSCAVLDSGEVYCWGPNGSGQLGDGTTTYRTTPVRVADITNAVEIAVGGRHSCAVLATGSLMCWGLNEYGQLGFDDRERRVTPTLVEQLDDVERAFAGHQHSCAIRADGGLWCWGANHSGQLGIGSLETTRIPTEVTRFW